MIYKIAVISDIHWGKVLKLTSKLNNNLYKYFINYLKETGVDIIVIAGDYFDCKLYLTSVEAQLANEFINNLKNTFPDKYILLLRGTYSHDLNQLDTFSHLVDNKFRIYNKACVDYIEDLKLLFLPEEYPSSKSYYDEFLNTTDKYDFAFFHLLFSHAGSYAVKQGCKHNKVCFSYKDFENNVYGRVVGGHIHIASEFKNIDYCGSFERDRHGEEEDKGFRFYEYDSSKRKIISSSFIKNEEASIFKTIEASSLSLDNIDNLIKEIDYLSKDIESLRIRISKTTELEQVELQNLISAVPHFKNVLLYKENSIISKSISKDQLIESENRKKRITEYDKLTFEQITVKYAKEMFNKNITLENISDTLSK